MVAAAVAVAAIRGAGRLRRQVKNRVFSSYPRKKEPHAFLCHPGIVLFWILRRRPKALKFIGPFRIAFLLFQFSVPLPFYAL